MNRKYLINHEVRVFTSVNELEAGDILMFVPSTKVSFSQRIIMLGQLFTAHQHGHYDTVHTAICTGRDAVKGPMIAHVAVVPNTSQAYHHEPLRVMLKRENDDRAFIVYRPSSPYMAHAIKVVAQNVELSRTFHWSIFSAMTCFTGALYLNERDANNTLSVRTFCSRFVIEVLKKASSHALSSQPQLDNYAQLSARSTPKALEAYLHQHADYQKIIYMGNEPLKIITNEIQKQLHRLSCKKDVLSVQKHQNAKALFEQVQTDLEKNSHLSEGEKVQYVLQAILPILKVPTGINWFEPTSYQSVVKAARKLGIFHHQSLTRCDKMIAKVQPARDIRHLASTIF